MLAIAMASAFFTAINSGIIKWKEVSCCLKISVLNCLKNNLSTEQLLSSLFCIVVFYALFLVYFDLKPTEKETIESKFRARRRAFLALIVVVLISLILAILAGVMYYNLGTSSDVMIKYAQGLGITSMILVLIQWAPQIFTTFRNKSAGSLSVLMLLMQLPGSLLVMYFQAILNAADFTTWMPYLFQFIQQVILVVMCAIFHFKDWRESRKGMPALGFRDGFISFFKFKKDQGKPLHHDEAERLLDDESPGSELGSRKKYDPPLEDEDFEKLPIFSKIKKKVSDGFVTIRL
eukprot:TRINITY_DN1930_c0_g1_i2.p1 TRINITY_DN1930_c0_g1~~TRINITY_DN1930_c0_g1_i2.p1  ORF type:complete len:291 (-),score=56.29 TRINITY_DN1930_c0_g1_i2:184-1056(-)